LIVKSVSLAFDEIQKLASITPVTSTSSAKGSVWKTSTSGRAAAAGKAREP
jgi:hypothetical protein